MCIYIYIYTHVCAHYIYIYIYIEREREMYIYTQAKPALEPANGVCEIHCFPPFLPDSGVHKGGLVKRALAIYVFPLRT